MNTFPLVRTRLNNERVMAALFAVALLHLLPRWAADPADIGRFLAVLALGLLADTAVNFIRFRKPVCAVSAAVTVALLHALAPGAPLWAELAAAAAALLFGKHAWGGAGKNPVNPAMAGLLLLGVFFPVASFPFPVSWFLLPAVLLSLPFIAFRPWAAAGMAAGMLGTAALGGGPGLQRALESGAAVYCCLVITDPVTTTDRPVASAMAGVIAGVLPAALGGGAWAMAWGVLASNLVSFAADRLGFTARPRIPLRFGKGRRVPITAETAFLDLADLPEAGGAGAELPCAGEILKRIEEAGVFGCGGAAFPTVRKIRAAMESGAARKHLIVNAVECDPGLIHDKWLLKNRASEIAMGIGLLCRCVPFATATVAAKHVEGLSFPSPVRLRRVKDFYPSGAEKTLISQVLGISLPHDAIPAEQGLLVLNVQTVLSVYEAVFLGRRAETKYVTLSDATRHTGTVARVRLGANVMKTAEAAFPAASFAFVGGGAMNARLAHDDTIVEPTTNFIGVGAYPDYRESPLCSRCGLCAAACPAGLPVREIAERADRGCGERDALHPERCLACGACSAVCPAGRNLMAKVKRAGENHTGTPVTPAR